MSAIIATYAVSRLTWRALTPVPAPWRLIAAHLASLGLLAALIMMIKSYFSTFPVNQVVVLVAPTLFWLILDALRGRGSKRRTQPVRGA